MITTKIIGKQQHLLNSIDMKDGSQVDYKFTPQPDKEPLVWKISHDSIRYLR